jgi:hypothetical protein
MCLLSDEEQDGGLQQVRERIDVSCRRVGIRRQMARVLQSAACDA